MSTRNTLRIIGHVGKVDTQKPGTEEEFVAMRVCTSEYNGKNDKGESQYVETWFDVLAFRGNRDRIKSASVKPGDLVTFEGPHRMRPSEKDGKTYENWALIVEDFDVLHAKGAAEEPAKADKPAAKKGAKAS